MCTYCSVDFPEACVCCTSREWTSAADTGHSKRPRRERERRRSTCAASSLRSLGQEQHGARQSTTRSRRRLTQSRSPAFSPLSVVMSKLSLRVPTPLLPLSAGTREETWAYCDNCGHSSTAWRLDFTILIRTTR